MKTVESVFGHMDARDRSLIATLLRENGAGFVREAFALPAEMDKMNAEGVSPKDEEVDYARRRQKQYGAIADWFEKN